jgi:hypothetical protein
MKISKRKILRLVPIIILIIICIFLIAKFQKNNHPKQTTENISIHEEKQQADNFNNQISSEKQNAILEINGLKIESELTESDTIYDFMKKARKDGKLEFKEKIYTSMGAFIEEINNIKNNGEENWIYYVNNQKANIGISNYKIKPGDIISWKFEKAL